MLKKYSISILAATVAASVSIGANAQTPLQVVDLGTSEGAYVTFPGGMNDLGEAVVINRNLWQQNIRFDLLDPDEFPDIDFDNITDTDYRVIRDTLVSPTPLGQNPRFQKLALEVSHLFNGQVFELDGFDAIDPATNRETDSANYLANDINLAGVIVGSAGEPYELRWTTDRNNEEAQYFMRDTFPRAFARINGEVIFLPTAEEDMFQGGTGAAFAINEQNQVVGRAAVAHIPQLDDRITFCQSEPEDPDEASSTFEELSVCVWRYWYANEVALPLGGDPRNPVFVEQAHMWTLNEDGSVEAQRLGGYTQTFEPDEDGDQRPPAPLSSRAYDVNDQGIAVGTALRLVTYFTGAENEAVLSSVVFMDGEVIALQDEFRARISEATAINDNNIVVGYSNNQVGSSTRSRAYWVDLNNLEAGRTYPRGFFNTSGWRPRAVNNQNVMVGRAEVTAEIIGRRPTVGFMYDIDTDTVTDLNTLLPCNSEYRIVDAYDINNDGEILALATTEVAIPIDDGTEVTGRMRAVRLQAGGEGTCGTEDQPVNRQGAAVHPVVAGFMAMFALLITRRRLKKS